MVTATHVGSNVWRIGPLNIALRSPLFTPLLPPTERSFSDGRLCLTFFFFTPRLLSVSLSLASQRGPELPWNLVLVNESDCRQLGK